MDKILLKLILSIAKLSGISPRQLAESLKKNRGYALELHYELGKDMPKLDS